MKITAYLDNSATTKPCKTACEFINNALCESWGNPSSLHSLGIEAEMVTTAAREFIAKTVSAAPEEIIFTGSGTEANNTALLTARKLKTRRNKIITSAIEHPSVLEPLKTLENEGFEIVKIGCDSEGVIDLKELEAALDSKTVLVSIMLVNNEIGSVQPVSEAVKITREKAPFTLFHCDAVQAYGKMPINVKTLGVDLLTASAHKIHGPKGIGMLYCKKGVHILPLISGGGQEKGRRSGTESVPLIAGFHGAATELADVKKTLAKVNDLNCYAREKLSRCDFIKINSPEKALPYILNFSVLHYRSETLLHFLESKGIFVSSGSACAKGEASHVLKALGLKPDESDSALRVSFSKESSREEIDLLVSALEEAVTKLRRTK